MLDGYNTGANTWAANPVNWIMGSITTDDAYKGSEQTDFPEFTQIEIYQWSAGNSVPNDKWVQLYEGIARANAAVKLVGQAAGQLSTADAERIEGEARFLRAYYHFELYKVWGNVPYFTEADADFVKSNENVDPLGDAIADLEAAVALLPVSQSERGRVDQIAAKAFLGKLYLYLPTPDAAKAKAVLDDVVAARTLAPCLKDIFSLEAENHESALFSMQASFASGLNANDANWLNQLAYPGGGPFGCCGFHQPSQNLVNAFKVDANGLPIFDNFDNTEETETMGGSTIVFDPRLDLTVGRDGVPYWDWGVHDRTWIRDYGFSGPYSPKKFTQYQADPVATGGWNNNALSGVDFPIIRLADAMLLLAEAELTLGNPGRAEQLVNLIRARAGNCAQGPDDPDYEGPLSVVDDIADASITWATYDVQPYPVGTFAADEDFAWKAVKKERRLELALEGHRFFDLQRWGDAEQVLNDFTASAAARRPYYAGASTFTSRHKWFPIPTIQINAFTRQGEQFLKQNTGW
jgi:hypothetical protein